MNKKASVFRLTPVFDLSLPTIPTHPTPNPRSLIQENLAVRAMEAMADVIRVFVCGIAVGIDTVAGQTVCLSASAFYALSAWTKQQFQQQQTKNDDYRQEFH